MKYQTYIGVDGCKAGWFHVAIDSHGECDFAVSKSLPELWQANRQDTLILVDIPIGLPSESNPFRACDILARKRLRPRRSGSVFSPPGRQTLSQPTYAAACKINSAVTGRKISMQTWNISAKIREVDNLLQDHPGTRAVIRECHPEICFYGLNDGSPMAYYKKSAEGQAERIAVLTRYVNQSRAVFNAAQDRFLRKEVARDDILDALAAAVTGYLSKGDLDTLPETPESDEQGLPMEMVYWYARAGEPGGP